MESGAAYDVFLNYRVKDSLELVDPLYHGMRDAGIRVFRDDDELSSGEEIGPSLLQAIQNSKIYILIFSKNYASSSWCLRELAYMVRLRSESDGEKRILPIFYDVQPSDVKLRTSLYDKDLLKLANEFGSVDLGQWWNALIEAAQTKGYVWDRNPKSLGRLVNLVVEEVLHRLKRSQPTILPEHLVGMGVRVSDVINQLDVDGDGVHFLGIWGMGGSGKTVLAKSVFNQLQSRFEGCSFVGDIREHSHRAGGLVTCQEKLLSDIIRSKLPSLNSTDEGRMFIRQRLANKKVLLVLDDIEHREQLEALAGGRDWFGCGSRIIITTRNSRVLHPAYDISTYEMGILNEEEAFNLFNMHAFGRGFPPEDWYALSREAVSILGGLPLALVVTGSSLFNQSKAVWQAALKKMKVMPDRHIQHSLMISFDALDFAQKQIFLDIACFFINKNVTDAIYMWDECGFFPRQGIDELVAMSLIKIADDHTILMHNQLKDLGREIVRQENIRHPGGRSRVWHHEEALDLIIRTSKNLEHVEALSLAGNPTSSIITNKEFARLPYLRFLELEGAILDGNFKNLLQKLTYLSWRFCPEEFRATGLDLQNLVVLNLSEGHITDNWGGWSQIKVATKLKVLDLTGCQGITRMPDLSGFLSLERLILCDCLRLGKIDCSIGYLKRLTYLNLKGCISLQGDLEGIGRLVNLEYLCLEGCSKITEVPLEDLKSLLELNISDTGIQVSPDSREKLKKLKVISSKNDKLSLLSAEEEPGRVELERSSTMESGAAYDVFLNYRVKDSLELVDPLYHRMIDAGIRVFRDDDELSSGEAIGPSLLQAIQNSKIYILIFSKNYASSSWCLRELAYMVRLRSESDGEKLILPIFYDVQPSDVKLRTSLYDKDLLKLADEFGSVDLGQWRNALIEAAQTMGYEWDGNLKSLGRLVNLVVEEVLHRLKRSQPTILPEHLVGMGVRVSDVINQLDVDGDGVHFLGIWGMGGSGKTVLAKAVFNQLQSHFEGCSFVGDIREHSHRAGGLVTCQEKLLSDIIQSKLPSFNSTDEGRMFIRQRLANKKVLLVLDDIEHREQLEALAGGRDWFGRGSRIIITTRNSHVLHPAYDISTYEMGILNEEEAFNLFNMHAFGRGFPPEDWYALSREAVSILGGLPLALVVTGSSLFNKSKAVWQDALKKMKVMPDRHIQDSLKISFDALEDTNKEIFLDIACFFINKNVTDAIYMWDDCGFFPRQGIDELVAMSLIKIADDHTILMHNQLKDLGREIVRQENIRHPGRRSRVWHHDEALDDLERVQALSLAGNPTGSIITNKEFARLRNLRFLELEGAILDGNFKNLLQKLRYLSWRFCPEEFRATGLDLQNLVVLNLSEGHITDDWGGWSQIKVATKLKVLDLTGCQGITRTPDLSGFLSLERLILCDCLKLRTMDSSIVKLKCLTYLNLKGCINLQGSLKEIGALVSLDYLCFEGCSKITELPSEMGYLKALRELNISDTGIRVLPDSLGKLIKLTVIRSEKDKFSLLSAEEPKRPRDELSEKLEGVNPNIKGRVSFLTALKLSDSSDSCIPTIPTMIIELVNLLTLDLEDCNKLQQLPKLPKSLEHLKLPLYLRPVLNILDLIKEVDFLLFDGSEDLSFHASNLILTSVQWIKKLNKQGNLESCLADILAASIKLRSLSWLNQLSLLRQGVQSLIWLSSFLSVLAFGDLCSTNIWSNISSFKNSSNLWIYQYEHEEIQLSELEGLRKLTLENCEPLQRVSNLSIWKNLKELRLIRCPKLVELQNLGGFESLEKLHVKLCQSIERLRGLSSLRKLDILIIEECGALRDVEGLDELDSLSSLKMWNCSMLKHLTDVSNSKIPDGCEVIIWNCGRLRNFGHVGRALPYKHYREAVLGTTDRDSGSDLAKRPGKMSDMELQGSVNLEESMEEMKDEGGQPPVDMETSDGNYAIAAVQNVVGIDKTVLADAVFNKSTSEEVDQNQPKGILAYAIAAVQNVVGIDGRVKQITDLLEMEVNDEVRILGIFGTNGIGKTTLAKAVYDRISSCFDGRSFLAEVEETTQDPCGIQVLQTRLIRDILERDREDPSFDERIEDFLDIFCERKVLIVVDDVEEQSHLHEIVGDQLHWFGPGSRIIVTSENEEILKEYDLEKARTYPVSALDDGQAFELFCKHAFRMQSSIPDDDGLANRIVNATGKLPLAVEVVGSFLRGKSIQEWAKMEESMKARATSSQKATVGLEEILDICYEGLNDQQKDIFLDIACFISGVDARIASCMWPSSYRPSSGCVLMPLAKIRENNELQMHRLLRCLGKRVCKQEESQDPSSRRFCTQDRVLKAMNRETGMGNVEALCFDFTAGDFQSMPDIRILKLDNAKVSGNFAGAFASLRWLCWQRCPLEFDAFNFELRELVILDLSWSKVTEDWGGWRTIKMEKLKVLNLTGCSDLLFTPDFSGYKDLEILILEGCSRLVKLDPSIGDLKCLVSLNLKFCSRLNGLPVEVGRVTALKELLIDGTSVREIPISIGNLNKLEILSGFKCFPLTHLPSSISFLTALSELSLDGAKVTELPSSLGELLKLTRLSLRDCRYMRELPDSLGKMGRSLKELDISGTSIAKLPDSVRNLQSLRVLRLDSSFIRAFPREIGNLTKLEELHASWCRSLKGAVPRDIRRLHHLRSLTLGHSGISSLPSEISTLSSLHTLDLIQCNEIEVLPQLPSSLICLRVSSKRMKAIPLLKDLKVVEELCLSDEDPKDRRPPSEQRMPESDVQHPLCKWFSRLWNLEWLQTQRIDKQCFLISFPKLRKLELSLSQIIKLKFEPADIPQLKTLTLSGLSLKEVSELPKTLSVFELYHSAIEEIEGLERLEALRRLDISNCNIQNLNGIGQLTSLTSLILSDCDALSLPDLSNLQSLKVLEIRRCKMIRQIEGIEKLTSLQKLNISECPAENSVQVQHALKHVMASSTVE